MTATFMSDLRCEVMLAFNALAARGRLFRQAYATAPETLPSHVSMLSGRLPVEHSVRLIAVARDSRLEVVEDAGAWVHDEQSAAVNRLVVPRT